MTFLLTVRNDMGPDPVQQGEAMKHYSAVCFDFDYTLGDSTDSIVAGFQYGFERLGHPIPDRETVRGTIGYLLDVMSNRIGQTLSRLKEMPARSLRKHAGRTASGSQDGAENRLEISSCQTTSRRSCRIRRWTSAWRARR